MCFLLIKELKQEEDFILYQLKIINNRINTFKILSNSQRIKIRDLKPNEKNFWIEQNN